MGILHQLTPIYKVTLNSDYPLMLHARDGYTYRPEMVFESDGGSIPLWIQTLRVPFVTLKRDAFLRPYSIHDNGCVRHGLMRWNGKEWEYRQMTRAKVDSLLYDALIADGANRVERALIYGAVRGYAKIACDW